MSIIDFKNLTKINKALVCFMILATAGWLWTVWQYVYPFKNVEFRGMELSHAEEIHVGSCLIVTYHFYAKKDTRIVISRKLISDQYNPSFPDHTEYLTKGENTITDNNLVLPLHLPSDTYKYQITVVQEPTSFKTITEKFISGVFIVYNPAYEKVKSLQSIRDKKKRECQ